MIAFKLGAVAVAGIAATWIWALAIDGEWEKQSQLAADVAYASLLATAATAVAALVAAARAKSWRLVLGALLVVAFALLYVFASVLAISFSRDPIVFAIM
jgi:hypothetical protein